MCFQRAITMSEASGLRLSRRLGFKLMRAPECSVGCHLWMARRYGEMEAMAFSTFAPPEAPNPYARQARGMG